MPQDMAEEGDDLRPFDRARVGLLQELPRGGDAADGRQFVPVGLGKDDRRFAARGPGGGDVGFQAEPDLIGEDDRFARLDLFFPGLEVVLPATLRYVPRRVPARVFRFSARKSPNVAEACPPNRCRTRRRIVSRSGRGPGGWSTADRENGRDRVPPG